MPDFLKEGVIGPVVFVILLVTAIPTWIVATLLALVLPASWLGPAMVPVQGLIYFLLAKLVRWIVRVARRRHAAA